MVRKGAKKYTPSTALTLEFIEWPIAVPFPKTNPLPRLNQATELVACDAQPRTALSVLNNRERRIFEGRRLAENPITLAELADEFGVSRERVRQIDVSSFEKVQKAVKNRVAMMEAPAPPRHIGFQFSPVVEEPAEKDGLC
jgi:hypothetical protein